MKKYIQPAMQELVLQMEQMIAASGDGDNYPIGGGSDADPLTHKKNGGWSASSWSETEDEAQ